MIMKIPIMGINKWDLIVIDDLFHKIKSFFHSIVTELSVIANICSKSNNERFNYRPH